MDRTPPILTQRARAEIVGGTGDPEDEMAARYTLIVGTKDW